MLLFYLLFSFLQTSCVLSKVKPQATSYLNYCYVPPDQQATMLGHWATQPIPIAFHTNDFNSNEIAAMTAAADQWNQFFQFSLSIQTLDYGTGANSARESQNVDPTGDFCTNANPIILNKQFLSNVVIYRRDDWPSSYPPQGMALTTTCHSQTSKDYSKVYFTFSIIELNYASFFRPGLRMPDLQTILLHEFGHLHGLDHSCEASKPGYPQCQALPADSNYLSAIMYPVFSFDASGNGEQRRALNDNDQQRANCLYVGPNGPAPIQTPSS